MRSITETSSAIDGACLEDPRLATHAQRLFRLGLVLGRAHHPILIFLLLLGQDLDVALRHALSRGRLGELLTHFTVGKCEWLLTTCEDKRRETS